MDGQLTRFKSIQEHLFTTHSLKSLLWKNMLPKTNIVIVSENRPCAPKRKGSKDASLLVLGPAAWGHSLYNVKGRSITLPKKISAPPFSQLGQFFGIGANFPSSQKRGYATSIKQIQTLLVKTIDSFTLQADNRLSDYPGTSRFVPPWFQVDTNGPELRRRCAMLPLFSMPRKCYTAEIYCVLLKMT